MFPESISEEKSYSQAALVVAKVITKAGELAMWLLVPLKAVLILV